MADILEIDATVYGGEIRTVKTRKSFTCRCCNETKPSGTMAKSYKCAESNDFYELKFCLDCNGKYKLTGE